MNKHEENIDMATLRREERAGEMMFLVELDRPMSGGKMFIDFSRVANEALEDDALKGYKEPGPALCLEIENAIKYGEYVETCEISESGHSKYDTREYTVVINNI